MVNGLFFDNVLLEYFLASLMSCAGMKMKISRTSQQPGCLAVVVVVVVVVSVGLL